jgi:L-ascorbate metabolism protein UlaG (beta-lactamase superfamily)
MTIKYTSNPDLPTIRDDWPGTPITTKGRFANHEYPFVPKFGDILKWKSKPNPLAKAKRNDTWRLEIQEHEDLDVLPDNSVTWLGHASFCIKISGYTIVIDPIYGSPSPFMPRYAPFPIPKTGMAGVDVLLVSHDHRDHVDGSSMRSFFKHNPTADVYTGLNMTGLLSKYSRRSNRIIEAGWWQRYPHPDLQITFLPTRHWGKRWLTDTNQRLWGSFHITDGKHSVFYGGDSGYGSQFAEIGQHFGGVDIALLGIGAFEPEWFMHPSHTSPSDALRAARDLQAKTCIPMHYGTFDLSDEPIGMPYRRIVALAADEDQVDVKAAMPGEVVLLW